MVRANSHYVAMFFVESMDRIESVAYHMVYIEQL